MFDRFTDKAREVMSRARIHAQKFQHDFIGTEHILLGLLDQKNSRACAVIQGFGLQKNAIQKEVTKNIQIGPKLVELVGSGSLPFTPRTKKMLECTMDYANECGHNHIGTCHLLYGLIRENDGFAAQVLLDCGLHVKEVDRRVRELYEKFPYKESLKEDDINIDMPLEAVLEAVKDSPEEKKEDSPRLTFANLLIGQKFILYPSAQALNEAVLLMKVYGVHSQDEHIHNAISINYGEYTTIDPEIEVIRIKC